ncbi:hypothetical protein ACN6K9_005642 [Streptomyces sp. SAS_267]|uniref:hypothetical protein n=1 Tax=Streptomyces sp. SAS_267 TaxID=3412750 RepID=UPI00403D43C4
MSTERPDNDATDPVGGHAEGPVEGAAEDAVAGPPEGAAEEAVTKPGKHQAGGHTQNRTEAPAEDRAEASADDRAEGSAEDGTEGSAQGRAEAPAEEQAEEQAEGFAEDPAENRAEGSAEGGTENSAQDRAEAPAEEQAEDQAEGFAEDPAENRTEGSAEEQAEGFAEDPAENRTDGSAEDGTGGSARDRAEGSGEGVAGGTADGAAGGTAPGAPGSVAGSGEETGEASGGRSAESPAGADAAAAPGSEAGGADGDGEDSPAEHPDVSAPVPGPVAGDGAGRVRRRHTPVVVASVVAAVLLVGGGGAYVAATTSGGGRSGTPAADGTPPRLALDGYAAATTGNGSTGGTAGIAPGEPNPYGTTYRASGTLPAGPGSAHVRWAEGTVTRAEVARLAKALGLPGTPRQAGDAWTVGTATDGTEPQLRVTADAPGTWTFSSSLSGGDNCTKVTVCESTGSGSETDSAPGPVSEAAAEKAAAPVLKAVGQDDAKLDASQLMTQVRVVNADPVLGGLPTYGWTTGLQIGPDGHVVGGSGQLKTPVEGDAYPVIGAKKALDLMNGSASATGEGRMGIGGCASPVPLKDRDEKPCEHPSPAPQAEAVTVEKATFGLAAQRADGRQVLVPSWLFEVRSPGAQDTYTVTHPAVEPAFLASPESPAPPSADPTAVPGQPSSPAATRDVGVQGYTADGRDLTVSFTGGVCADYTASASESSGKVTVTVTEKPWKNTVCIMIAKIYEKTVRLDEPLGGREVVGSDGKAVHHGRFAIPEPSGAASAGPR